MKIGYLKLFLVSSTLFLSYAFLTAQNTWYVNDDNTAGGNGTSWATAFNDLQVAITASNIGDQIWIKEGSYKPTNTTDRSIAFSFKERVEVFGGFPNTGNPTITDRNPIAFPSILSGDIGTPNDNSDNTYHVVYMSGFFCYQPGTTFLNTTLDGLIIQDGNANGDTNIQWHWNGGGGLFLEVTDELGGGFHSGMLVNNCVFKNNEASYGGAGLYVRSAFGKKSNFTFSNCTFDNNKVPNGWGAAVLNDAYNGTNQCSYINCTFTNNQANQGAAMGLDGRMGGNCSPNIVNCLFDNNFASNSGGAIRGDNADNGKVGWNICQSKFINNQADWYAGGAIAAWGGGTDEGVITDCEFINNRADNPNNSKNGGAIFFDLTNNVAHTTSIEHCQFSGNKSNWNGGAISIFMFNNAKSNGLLKNCFFNKNEALWGGALQIGGNTKTNLSIANCHFNANKALRTNNNGGDGGAINDFTSININDCSFSNNHAAFSGGALLFGGSNTSSIHNCKFIDNQADNSGGAVRTLAGENEFTQPQFIQCVFQGNSATNNGSNGGAMINNAFNGGICSPIIKSSTFYNNSADFGKSISNFGGSVIVDNSILWGGTGSHVLLDNSGSASTVTYSIVEGGFTGTGNQSVPFPPDFVNPANYDLRLTSNSIGINQGNNDSLPASLVKDLIGADRILANVTDMGAFEHGTTPFELGLNSFQSATDTTTADGSITVNWNTNLVNCDTLFLSVNGPAVYLNIPILQNTGSFTLDIDHQFQLPSGCYWVTLQDCQNQLQTAVVYIGISSIPCSFPIVNINSVNPQSCNGNDGTITIVPSGNIADYQYSITGRAYQTSNSFANLSAGVYDRIYISEIQTGCEMVLPTTTLFTTNCSEETGASCWDGIDNDGDGLVDCADGNCAPELFLLIQNAPSCTNGNDGLITIPINGMNPQLFISTDDGINFNEVTEKDSFGHFILSNLSIGDYTLKYWVTNGCEQAFNFSLLCQDAPPNNCPDKQVIVGTATDSSIVQAADTIISTQVLNPSANMSYFAGKSIVLSPGFEVKAGAIFLAKIEDCSAQALIEESASLTKIERISPLINEAAPLLKQPIHLKVYPNPFYHQTTIEFELPTVSTINIQLHDLNGRVLKNLLSNAPYDAGKHQLILESSNLQAGIYYVNLVTDRTQLVKKIMVMK